MEGTNLRWLSILAVSLMGLVFASTAGADVATNSNSAVAISSSLMNGSNGASATAGNIVSADASVTNLLDANAYVRIFVIADWALRSSGVGLRLRAVGLNALDRFAWVGAFSSGGLSDDFNATFPRLDSSANPLCAGNGDVAPPGRDRLPQRAASTPAESGG